ncbi:hypothetical protein FGM00_12945 [Aggregatimonas sangjinii]|uniref:Uncharacterized protein n=1 Tax=Aggregatimonas sangjinii TaxID=2583587 RepID=A0A5B7SWA4_9FLAO|nr:hypothetical protein [Aggregatimonas sangjinii]QCX00974.1 hypothetical protein FGM00_12945 [Aggregatimonas sangjinii]
MFFIKRIRENSIVFLVILGLLLLTIAVGLFAVEEAPRWVSELGKALMTISASSIFGGIIKLVFEIYQDEKSAKEREQNFKKELLDQLRNVFDRVDNARLLIEAHKSARTYGERMRFDIIPCITTLYDIKRSLVDTYAMAEMSKEKLGELRLNIHYMIAYLKALTNEYTIHYPTISHQQFLHEELKKRARDDFAYELTTHYPDKYFTDEFLTSEEIKNRIKRPPLWVWNAILDLEQMEHFIKDPYDGPYRKMFMDFYEPSKRILKGEPVPNKSAWYREEHMNEMRRIDQAVTNGELKKEDSLVTVLIGHLKQETAKIRDN